MLYSSKPVSYTHLDVYKRQIVYLVDYCIIPIKREKQIIYCRYFAVIYTYITRALNVLFSVGFDLIAQNCVCVCEFQLVSKGLKTCISNTLRPNVLTL